MAMTSMILALGLKLGGAINAFNTMGAAFTPELEVGLLLPPPLQELRRGLQLRVHPRVRSGSLR